MTEPAERKRLYHRGVAIAAPASLSRVRALEAEHYQITYIDDSTVIVERAYQFNLVGSHWHRIDDPSCHGYLVATLRAEINRRRNSEKPAADSISISAPELTTREPIAEPVAGPSSSGLVQNSWP